LGDISFSLFHLFVPLFGKEGFFRPFISQVFLNYGMLFYEKDSNGVMADE
jgi:hypothetical protein